MLLVVACAIAPRAFAANPTTQPAVLNDVGIDQNARLIAEQSVISLLGSIASSAPYLTKKFVEPRLIFKENIPVQ